MLKQFEFGYEAIDYVSSCLRESEKALSSHLLDLSLRDGKVFAFLPDDSDLSARLSFRLGGIIRETGTRAKLISFIQKYLELEENHYLILELTLTLPTDPWLAREKTKYFYYKDTVCIFLNAKDANQQEIDQALRDAASAYLEIGILTSAPGGLVIQPRQEVTSEILECLAENSEYIFVSAYDGESELVWCRDSKENLMSEVSASSC